MQWYYSADGQQQGPVSQSVLESLAQAGTINADTFVWCEGMPNWASYGSVFGAAAGDLKPAAGAATALADGTQARCAECGGIFSKDEMLSYAGAHVCAACKPLFVQKLREGVNVGGALLWRSGKRLVAGFDAVLPTHCVKCNALTDTPQIKRKLYWHHPAVYLALLVNVLVYVIVAMITRKRTTVTVSMCAQHRASRRNAIIVAWLLVVAAIGLFVAAGVYESGWPALGGAVAFLGGIIWGLVKGRLVAATKIAEDRVWIAGCGKEFLAEFPEWNGA